MKLIYSGKTKEFTSEVEERVAVKLAKLSKMVERRGEREAHVCHQMERHLHKVEIILNIFDHALVGEGADADLATALTQAVDKIETQIVKLKNRWRDTRRDPKAVRESKENWEVQVANEPQTNPVKPNFQRTGNPQNNGAVKTAVRPKIFHVNYDEDRKPMTLQEALIEMENGEDYVVYRDANQRCLSVLVRRRDGNYDLIQS